MRDEKYERRKLEEVRVGKVQLIGNNVEKLKGRGTK